MHRASPIAAALALFVLVLTVTPACNDHPAAPPANNNGPHEPRTWYVDAEAQGSGSGFSWEDAFDHPQDAADVSSSGDTVWVAEGLYPSRSPGSPAIPVLSLEEGVRFYGGFAPGDTSLSSRDPSARETILDGGGTVYHVVVGASNALLDGFTVTGGYAGGAAPDDVGGGMLNDGAAPAVARCTFTGNRASWHGAGIFNRNSAVSVTDCVFTGNTAAYNGGAVYNEGTGAGGAHPTIARCSFVDNIDSRFGAGIYNHLCSAVIRECTFDGNTASHNGGGVYNYNSESIISGCLFTGNGSLNGGGIYINASEYGLSPRVENCLFMGNEVFGTGGGLYSLNAAPVISSCTFSGNAARYGGAAGIWNSPAVITNCIMWGDSALFYDGEINTGGYAEPAVSFSDIDQDGYCAEPDGSPDANGNIRLDPLFVTGPFGDYYLSDIAAGQPATSPCVDAGSASAETLGLGDSTTRTDNAPDGGIADIGYHFPIPR